MAEKDDDYSRPPKDKAELLARIEREWKALQAVFAGLSDGQMSVPDAGGWSIKDNLAHLSTWENFMCRSYIHKTPAHTAMGIDETAFKTLDETGINAVIFGRNKDRTVADVLAGLERTHREVLADLAKLSFEEMMAPLDPADPQKRPLIGWIIGNTYDHYREHRLTIEKFARK